MLVSQKVKRKENAIYTINVTLKFIVFIFKIMSRISDKNNLCAYKSNYEMKIISNISIILFYFYKYLYKYL